MRNVKSQVDRCGFDLRYSQSFFLANRGCQLSSGELPVHEPQAGRRTRSKGKVPIVAGCELGTDVLPAVSRARVTVLFLEFLLKDQTSVGPPTGRRREGYDVRGSH